MRYLLIALLLIAGLGIAQDIRINREIGGRDEAALRAYYSKQEVDIVDTREWPSIQTCYQVRLYDPRTNDRRSTFAMMSSGDPDRDNWRFAGEFQTMQKCVEAFNRG